MITQAGWIAIAIGAACGFLVLYLLIRMAKQDPDDPALAAPFETNGEADLMPHAKESFADVKDTF